MLPTFLLFIIINFLISFAVAFYSFSKSKQYYYPCTVKDEKGNIIDVHKYFEVFRVNDTLNFFQLWIGAFFFFPIKFILSLINTSLMKFRLQFIDTMYPKSDTDPQQWSTMKRAISFWSKLFLISNGVYYKNKPLNEDFVKNVYKKYLGENYDFSDNKYSLIISNHTGFFEIVVLMAMYSAGFIAKKGIKNYYFVGPIATAIHCLYVDREDESARKMIFEQLEKRQKEYYNGKFLAPLDIFPEGTTTNGRYILKFKRGAFYSLLPIKPLIININQDDKYHLVCGGGSAVTSYIKNFCHGFNFLYVSEMPVIRPTEYMFEKYGYLSKEKWEVYAEVVKLIYCEIGGFQGSLMGFRDMKKYNRIMFNQMEKDDIKSLGISNQIVDNSNNNRNDKEKKKIE